jgi:hypothetical protein
MVPETVGFALRTEWRVRRWPRYIAKHGLEAPHLHKPWPKLLASLSLSVLTLSGCKEEAGPRADPRAEEACKREPELSLRDFCAQSDEWEQACDQYARYDDALEAALADCSDTGFPVAVGDCDLRVIDRSLSLHGTRYYYDGDGELVGVLSFTDQVFTCPKGFPREQSVAVQTGGRIDDECEPCHVCGATLEDPDVCAGETGEPYVQQCRERFDFAPDCEPCACEHCYPWTFTDNSSTNELFQTCVADRCEVCLMTPEEEDAGMEPVAEEDAGR